MLMTTALAGSARGFIIYVLETPVVFTRCLRLAKYTNKTSCGAFRVLTDGNASSKKFLTQKKSVFKG